MAWPRHDGIGLHRREDGGADGLVMGTFEQSKFAHDLVGGVTTDVIRDTRVPVFLSQ